MKRIRELRKKRDMSMKTLGNMVNVSESAISMYETDKRVPDINVLYQLSEIFDVSIDYITGRSDDDSPISNKKIQPADEAELDAKLTSILKTLSEDEIRLVEVFVAGLKARRTD